ncbi:MAG: sulfite exporter TauE/SafE family protein [Phycisphaerales bacterium]
MSALIVAVMLASLMGSMHCAGMCGGFLAFAVTGSLVAPTVQGQPGRSARGGPSKSALQAAYNGGRLLTYVSLGGIAGAIGSAVDLGGEYVGVQRTAAVIAGALMIGFGVIAVLRVSGVRVGPMPMPRALRDGVMRGHRAAATWPPLGRALAVGLLTTLLPCGWLYAFVITAAGTGDAAHGAVTMAAFWIGTLPMMVGLGTGLQSLAGPLRRRLPVVMPLLLVAVGVYTVAGRLAMPAMGSGNAAMIVPAGREEAAQRAERLADETPPCCRDEGR